MALKNSIVRSGVPPTAAQSIVGGVIDNQTAVGNSQATAFALIASNTVFTTVGSGTGAILRSDMSNGDWQRVSNLGLNTLKVYPPVGGTIDGGSTNASVNVSAGKAALFVTRDNLNFFSQAGA